MNRIHHLDDPHVENPAGLAHVLLFEFVFDDFGLFEFEGDFFEMESQFEKRDGDRAGHVTPVVA